MPDKSITFWGNERISRYEGRIKLKLNVQNSWFDRETGRRVDERFEDLPEVQEALEKIGERGTEILKRIFPVRLIEEIWIYPFVLRVFFSLESTLDSISIALRDYFNIPAYD